MGPGQQPPLGQNPGVPPLPVQPAVNPAPPPQPGQLPNSGFPPGHNPYEFIMNGGTAPRKPPVLKGGSLKSRVLIILGGGILAMILVVMLSNAFRSASNANAAILSDLVAEQQEIVRVSTLGIKDAVGSPAKNFAQSTYSSVTSEQIQLQDYLKSKKIKLTKVQLNSKLDSKTDTALETAKQANAYDDTLTTTLLGLLSTYANDASKAYKTASNTTSKGILESSFNSSAALIKGYGPPAATTP
jgi:hypothetical protein